MSFLNKRGYYVLIKSNKNVRFAQIIIICENLINIDKNQFKANKGLGNKATLIDVASSLLTVNSHLSEDFTVVIPSIYSCLG